MTLREATRADIPAMHRVRLAVRENTLSNPARITEADYIEALDVAGRTWVVEADGQIVAFATAYRTGSIWALFVHPDHEGRGHGKALLDTMVDWLWTQGHTQLTLTTQPGTRAERFYLAYGWRVLGTVATGEVRLELVRPKLVLVIHGAGEPRRRGHKIYWEPLLAHELGRAYEVRAPRMPDPENPDDGAWRARIAELTREADCPVLVGHSFGASTLLRFFAEARTRPAFRGLFLVSTPFWERTKHPDFALTAEHLRRLQSVSPLFFYQSTDDPVVARAHFEKYKKALPHAVFRLLDGRGHEFDQDGFPELVADIRSLKLK